MSVSGKASNDRPDSQLIRFRSHTRRNRFLSLKICSTVRCLMPIFVIGKRSLDGSMEGDEWEEGEASERGEWNEA